MSEYCVDTGGKEIRGTCFLCPLSKKCFCNRTFSGNEKMVCSKYMNAFVSMQNEVKICLKSGRKI